MMGPSVCWTPIAAILLMGAWAPEVALAQGEPSRQGQEDARASQPILGLEQEGSLRGVDWDQGFFLVVGENDNEMLFYYDDQTEVVGQEAGVQGLTGETGTWLRIEYRAEGTRAIAERIEMMELGDAPEPAPTAGDPGA